jgi:hypothetical protein
MQGNRQRMGETPNYKHKWLEDSWKKSYFLCLRSITFLINVYISAECILSLFYALNHRRHYIFVFLKEV